MKGVTGLNDELTDIHIHLIHGVDDGPGTMEESAEMLRSYAKEGIKTLIATPHKRYGLFEYDLETVERNFEALRDIAGDLGIDLYLGCEYHACSDMIDDLRAGRVHTLADTDYVLVEFSFVSSQKEMADAVYSLVSNGYRPVIAHVERYEAIQQDPEFCRDLNDKGALIQINAGSIMGEEGHRLRATCKYLLKKGLADIVASDAHGTKFRKSALAKSYRYVVKKYTEYYADRIFKHNPREVVKR